MDFTERFRIPKVDSKTRQIRILGEFIDEKDEYLSNIRCVRDLGYNSGKEAIRVLKSLPKCTSAEQNGTRVGSRVLLPIKILLSFSM